MKCNHTAEWTNRRSACVVREVQAQLLAAGLQGAFGFCEFSDAESARQATLLLDEKVLLLGRRLRIQPHSKNQQIEDCPADVLMFNLPTPAPTVTELHDVFSPFFEVVECKVETGYGRCRFRRLADAQQAVQMKVSIRGYPLRIELATVPPAASPPEFLKKVAEHLREESGRSGLECKFGFQCKSIGCKDEHPVGREIEANPEKVICNFGGRCKRFNCFYVHPGGREIDADSSKSVCARGKDCDIPGCIFTHGECKFGRRCKFKDCHWAHSEGKYLDHGECKFGRRCKFQDCHWAHSEGKYLERDAAEDLFNPDDRPLEVLALHIANISSGTMEEELYEIFGSTGDLESVKMNRKRNTQELTGQGLCRYSSLAAAERALEELQGVEVDGHCLLLKLASKRKRSRSPRSRSVGSQAEEVLAIPGKRLFVPSTLPTVRESGLHQHQLFLSARETRVSERDWAELLRLSAAAAANPWDIESPFVSDVSFAGVEIVQLKLRIMWLLLLVRKIEAKWGKAKAAASEAPRNSIAWQPAGGKLSPEVLQQLLWAKALASQVMSSSAASSSTRKPRAMCERGNASKVAGGPRHGRPGQRGQPPSTPATASSGATSGSTAPFARNAAARAWAALHLAAGEAPAQSAGRQEPWDSSPEDAARLAAAMAPDNEGASRLLLEIAVLVFAMGCRLGCSGKARLLALPLAQAAANRLTAAARASANCDDSARAAQKAVEVLAAVAEVSPTSSGDRLEVSRTAALQLSETIAPPSPLSETTFPRGWRWRLAGYRPTEEIWILRLGTRRLVLLPAPPPFSWCMEGLALSETTPDLEQIDGDVET
ncbi:unnamed protein product [Polarella glacialis]|uniref:RRM domain-containing protein n=1 Tax=Polarella glacialis TaxID=89957 RepID=A0A813LU72_POLGL|nr:unnamed protein product [Polarella glacialis]